MRRLTACLALLVAALYTFIATGVLTVLDGLADHDTATPLTKPFTAS